MHDVDVIVADVCMQPLGIVTMVRVTTTNSTTTTTTTSTTTSSSSSSSTSSVMDTRTYIQKCGSVKV